MGFSVTETNYTGAFTADASACGSSASVSGGPTSFTVSPGTQAGNCSITVSDDHSQSAGVQVFVTSGGMSVTTNQLQFSGPTDSPQSFFASTSAPFATTITVISPPNPLVATVSPASGPAPTVQFTVTPVGNGRTSLTVDDGMGGQAVVSIGVGTTPLLVRNHHQRPRVNPALPGPRAPKKPWPSSPPIGGSTNKPSVYQPPVVHPVVIPAPAALTVGTLALRFTGTTMPQSLSVQEPGYNGGFTVVSSNPAVVTLLMPVGRGPSAWFTIVPHAAGQAVLNVSDERGQIRQVFVTVQPPPMSVPRETKPGRPQLNS